MPKASLSLALLAWVAVLPAPLAAGPPEGPSAKMALAPDEVADGLRKYRNAKNEAKRLRLLDKLARTRDPRVAVALGDALSDPSCDVQATAAIGILFHQAGGFTQYIAPKIPTTEQVIAVARDWWKENESDLRRRAKALAR